MARQTFATLTTALFAASLLAGCSGDPEDDDRDKLVIETDGSTADIGLDTGPAPDSGPDVSEPDTTRDVGVDAAPDTADVAPDSGDDDFELIEDCRESTPVSLGDRQPVETGDWVAAETNSNENPIRPSIRSGDFTVPASGTKAQGVFWDSIETTETGIFEGNQPSGGNLGYAATTIEVDEPTVLVAEMNGIYELFAGGQPYSGDIYGDNYLVPVPLEPGNNQLVVRYTGRTAPKVTLTEASGDIAIDKTDASYPHLRVGHDAEKPLGLHVLNLTGRSLTDVTAEVVENEHFEATSREFPAIGPDTRNQLGFQLVPKSEWSEPDTTITVQLRVDACELEEAYEFEYELKTRAATKHFRQTFTSPIDGSVQYYGVRPPENYQAGSEYGMVMSLHGAGVDGGGLVSSYSDKDWAWIISPTNRRPFGFNWEEWGHFNALASLEDAKSRWAVNDERVHITGHSMGGHGTWHVGVHNPGEFATIVPSAGWESIYSYPPGRSSNRPDGTLARARAHSDTKEYLSNIKRRSVYVIHGKDDNNVPTAEGEKMCQKAKDIIPKDDDVKCHFEPGAEHWWDGDAAEGTDCVDWPDAWTMMENTTLDPTELEFDYKTPGPWYGPTHSYVKVDSSETPMQDVELTSTKVDDQKVELTTTNVRSLELDGDALQAKGIQKITVDGDTQQVTQGTMRIGPEAGKNAEQHGPLNQVYRSPFCFVYPFDGSDYFRKYATFLASSWSVRGNGYACAMPFEKLDESTREDYNIIYVGLDPDRADLPQDRPFSWDGTDFGVGQHTYTTITAVSAFPEDDDMAAAIFARPQNENLLLHPLFMPFNSRRSMPDFMVLEATGSQNAALRYGFYDANWEPDADLRDGG